MLSVLSAVFLAYPLWRTMTWLESPLWLVYVVAIGGFASQFVARIGLRKMQGSLALWIRRGCDLLLGVSPVLLGAVLLGELIILSGLIPPTLVGLAVIVIVLLAGVWGIYNARTPMIEEVRLESGKLATPLRFAQISDVHIGSRSSDFLERVITKVSEANPDFLCITGDFIDQPGISEERLSALRAFGKPIYFSTGNHEFYEDFDEILVRLNNLGVNVLRQNDVFHDGVQVVGVDDHSDPNRLDQVLPKLAVDRAAFTVLMYHRPHGLEHAAEHGVDLMISGHTHDGQIKPFNWLVRRQFEYIKGLYVSECGRAHLYVNQGTGTWGPTMRLGTRCEITVFNVG